MAKRLSKAAYAAMLRGDVADDGTKLPGLRTVANGFDAASGFNLNNFDAWTAGQRRKVREVYAKLRAIEAQPVRIVRTRNEKNRRALMQTFAPGADSKAFKVAFVPDLQAVKLPGAKPRKQKVKLVKGGAVIDDGQIRRYYAAFDPAKLALDPQKEISRALSEMPSVALFFVKTGLYQTRIGYPRQLVAREIMGMMARYEQNKWQYIFRGLVGYTMPKGLDRHKLARQIREGIKARKAANAHIDRKTRRKK